MPTQDPVVLTPTIFARRLRELEERVARLGVAPGSSLGSTRTRHGGITITDNPVEPISFIGKIHATGPTGQADYTDERYWVNEVVVTNKGGTGTEALDLKSKVELEWSDKRQWVTATNIAEYDASGPGKGTHKLKPGDIVEVHELRGQTDLTGVNASNPWDSLPVGTVGQEIGRKARMAKRFWYFERGTGGGGVMEPVVVIKRYGAFVSVLELNSVDVVPVPKNPLRGHDWVWAQTPWHIWLKLPTPDVGDVVMMGSLATSINVRDLYKKDAQGTLVGSNRMITVTRYCLGTVPEADLNALNGVDPDCVFTPFETGCTMLPVIEDPRPA